MDAYTKRPSEILRVEFDMRDFVADVSPDAVTFVVRCESGLTVDDETTVPGLIVLALSGGRAGRVYQFGIEATTAEGQSRVDIRRMRLVEPVQPAIATTTIPAPSSVYADGYADDYA